MIESTNRESISLDIDEGIVMTCADCFLQSRGFCKQPCTAISNQHIDF